MNAIKWTEPNIHEALATLYLRLNGYFTTSLILHSQQQGKNRGEVDCLAVRHPHHSQLERGVKTSEFLAAPPDQVDLIVCEVKSSAAGLIFNKSLSQNLPTLLRWAGTFNEGQATSVAERLKPLLESNAPIDKVRDGVVEGQCLVRPLLCCPPCKEDDCTDRWCLVGTELLCYINMCLNPSKKPDLCSTRYDFGLWGYALTPLITYFKSVKKGDSPRLEDLYSHLGSIR